MMSPTLQQVKNAIGNRVLVYNLDINKAPNLAEKYQITTLPMMVLFFEGQVVWQTKAVLSKEEIIKNVLDHTQ
jgi:thioredoxin 1